MSVAHDASSESHTGTTPSTSEASFSWSHGGAVSLVKGVLVFVFNTSATADTVSSVTYGGVALTAVTGGRAVDTASEFGSCKAYFLGSGVPQGTQTVVVNRTNNANSMYAIAITFTAAQDTTYAGVVLLQEDQVPAEQSITDNGSGVNAVRCSGNYYGGTNAPAGGANSTRLQDISIAAARSCAAYRETTAGTGTRSVGPAGGTSDDVAAVYLAICETIANAAATPAVLNAITALPTASPVAVASATPAMVGSLTAVATPAIIIPAVSTPGVVNGVTVLPPPNPIAASAATPGVVAGQAALPAPSPVATAAASPAMVASVSDLPTPAAKGNANATPNVVADVVAVPTPTAVATSGANATPAMVASLATLPAPSVIAPALAAPGVVAALISVPNPAAHGDARAGPGAVGAVSAVPIPIIDIFIPDTFVFPAAIAAVSDWPVPSIALGATPQPAVIPAVVAFPGTRIVRVPSQWIQHSDEEEWLETPEDAWPITAGSEWT